MQVGQILARKQKDPFQLQWRPTWGGHVRTPVISCTEKRNAVIPHICHLYSCFWVELTTLSDFDRTAPSREQPIRDVDIEDYFTLAIDFALL